MQYFVNGVGLISPQHTFDNATFLADISTYNNNVLSCITPDFKAYVNPIMLRRLSRMLRIGLTASVICQRDSGVTNPDGIVTATGYGFLDETEKFLKELLERHERQLTPTFFMQGTYNALAGLVALSIKCMGYNNTFVSKGFAFENALLDTFMHLHEKPAANYLVGAYDEAAPVQYKAGRRDNQYKAEFISSADLYTSATPGTLQGESAAFFNLSGQRSATTWCAIADLEIIYRPEQSEVLSTTLETFLDRNGITLGDIDLWINGISGDSSRDGLMIGLENTALNMLPQARFKHLSGEYCTATSFALWLGAGILKHQRVPDAVKVAGSPDAKQLKHILVVNHYMDRNYSMMLLRRA